MIRRFILRLLGLGAVRDQLGALHVLHLSHSTAIQTTRWELESRLNLLEARAARQERDAAELARFDDALRAAIAPPAAILAGVQSQLASSLSVAGHVRA